jgi:magnesium transporter
MIKGYAAQNGRLRPIEDVLGHLHEALWLDLLSPTADEEAAVETTLAIDLPTREEMEEIEVSSRLYLDEGGAFMTATLPAKTDSEDVQMAPVTFVLTEQRLITVRYHDPRVFNMFAARAEKAGVGGTNAQAALVSLLEAIIERLADILERAARDIDAISRNVFQQNGTASGKSRNFQKLLEAIGRKGDLLSDIRDSLMTLERLFGFLGNLSCRTAAIRPFARASSPLVRDCRSLTAHASFVAEGHVPARRRRSA